MHGLDTGEHGDGVGDTVCEREGREDGKMRQLTLDAFVSSKDVEDVADGSNRRRRRNSDGDEILDSRRTEASRDACFGGDVEDDESQLPSTAIRRGRSETTASTGGAELWFGVHVFEEERGNREEVSEEEASERRPILIQAKLGLVEQVKRGLARSLQNARKTMTGSF